MTTWTPFTLAVVTNAMPSDVGQLYTNWITAHPEKANRLGEIVVETRQTFSNAVAANPRTSSIRRRTRCRRSGSGMV